VLAGQEASSNGFSALPPKELEMKAKEFLASQPDMQLAESRRQLCALRDAMNRLPSKGQSAKTLEQLDQMWEELWC
jgi:hypothetical protein